MSFLRHEEIYRSDVRPGYSWGRQLVVAAPALIGCDEFPVGYSLAGCPPAEPASASPTGDDSQQSTLPYNDFSANGNYPLNFLSQSKGALQPETFTFLGFTHYCGQRHKSGTFTVGRITAKKRMVAKLKAIKAELQRRMHDRMAVVGAWLRKVVLGYYQYHAVPGNTTQLRIFKLRVCRLWQSVLVRRSQRAKMRWERFTPVLNRWIPPPRVLHPYPDARFYATHPS